MGSLKIFDTVQFSLLDTNLMKVKDDYAGAFKPHQPGQQEHISGMGTVATQQDQQATQTGLLVRIAATHSGLITRNNGFYLPDKMKKGASSFTDNYPKPVLLHHDDDGENIGRVIQATYRDTSGSIADKYDGLSVKDRKGNETGTINEKLIKDFSSGKMPFGMQVDVVTTLLKDSILEDSSYDGLGYIELVANITDPEAIQKLLDGRYLTGSVGATTNAAICSVCRTDWTDSGQCEHKPGGIYDGAKCFVIAGSLVYDEYSFVNVPADRHSKVLELNYNGIQDSVLVEENSSTNAKKIQLGFPQYESPNKEENSMKVEDAKKENVEVQDPTVTQDEVTTDVVTTESTDTVVTTDKVEDSTTEGTVAEGTSETVVEDEKKEEKEEKVEDNTSKEEEVVVEPDPTEELVTKALSDATLTPEENEALYDALWTEVLAAVEDGEVVLDTAELEEAKLSAEKRSKLPKSSFCAPNRSLVVSDATHTLAARRLVNQAKIDDAVKEDILNVISRKIKANGWESKKDSTAKATDAIAETAVKAAEDSRVTSAMMQILSIIESEDWFDEEDKAFTAEEMTSLAGMLKRLATKVTKDHFSAALTEAELISDSTAVAEQEQALLDQVVSLEQTIGDLRDRLEANRKEYADLSQDFDALQDSLVKKDLDTRKVKESHLTTLRVLRDHKVEAQDLSILEDSTLDLEIEQTLENVDMVKITDKLGDGMSREPTGEVHSPVEINDSTENPQNITDVAEVARIWEHYMTLRMGTSQSAAEAFLVDMRKKGKLPQE